MLIVPLGHRCNIFQILSLVKSKDIEISTFFDGSVIDIFSAYRFFHGYPKDSFDFIENRINHSLYKQSGIRYLSKHWNHRIFFPVWSSSNLHKNCDAACLSNICAWVHEDPRPEVSKKKLILYQKIQEALSTKNKEITLVYLTPPPEQANSQVDFDNYFQRIINVHNSSIFSHSRLIIFALRNSNLGYGSVVKSYSFNNIDAIIISSPDLQFFKSKLKLDLDLSLIESQKIVITLLNQLKLLIPS